MRREIELESPKEVASDDRGRGVLSLFWFSEAESISEQLDESHESSSLASSSLDASGSLLFSLPP